MPRKHISDEDRKRSAARAAFLKELARISEHFEWEIDRWGQIRAVSQEVLNCLCPITAIEYAASGHTSRCAYAFDAAQRLGIDAIAMDIVLAADYRDQNNAFRLEILKAVGLRK